ncbi:hypothetical protein WJX84_003937 [Apatococcus fuscideae]|uniref:Uncharacterized protein n=1 Tax=Apatococcus fuscideae TaxID=2026836 RepID=A0AAW1T2S5_9CHLO
MFRQQASAWPVCASCQYFKVSRTPQSATANRLPKRRKLCTPRAAEDNKHSEQSDESTESLFMKELRRRGYQNSDGTNKKGDSSRGPATSTSAPDRPPIMRGRPANNPPRSQLDVSRQLNSEGLEGLPGRASVLLRLGLTFFLGFAPFILVVGLLFGGIYLFEGSRFIHGGRPGQMPEYINPDILLAEPAKDQPRVPYQ